MKNPNINRMIGYIILFIGFFVFYKGGQAVNTANEVDGYSYFVYAIGLIIVVCSIVWMFIKVRCPHCNGILHWKLRDISICPHCGKRTDQ